MKPANDNKVATSNGVGFGSLLFLLFLGLKLTGHIDWSWWWVTAPLWGPIALAVAVVGVVSLVSVALAGARVVLDMIIRRIEK